MNIQLSNCEVTLKDEFTWGDDEKMNAATMKGAKQRMQQAGTDSDAKQEIIIELDPAAGLESKYVAIECAVIEIIEDGQKKQFTRQWVDNLSRTDGGKLYEAVNELAKKKD